MPPRQINLFAFAFAFFLIISYHSVTSQLNLVKENKKTTLMPVVERIFSRKKRWMIFPKGSNLKVTVNISKRLLAVYPKGFNFNIEAAVYYPMPSSRIDLIPKRLRRPTTMSPVTQKPAQLNIVGIPGSLIKYRAKPAIKPPKVQRVDQNVAPLQLVEAPYFSLHSNSSQKWSKYSSPEYLNKYVWSKEKQQKYVNKYSKYNNKWLQKSRTLPQKYSSSYFKSNSRHRYSTDIDNLNKQISSIDDYDMEYEPVYFKELEQFQGSPNYHSYRGRRDLFYHFEGLSQIVGIDIKWCFLRAVCDSKQFLMPPGLSMIQDILRVVFTFPTINGLKDDYSRIMEEDYQTCDARIRNKCPFSILDWLLNSKRSIKKNTN